MAAKAKPKTKDQNARRDALAIVVGGGPAPGINGVIAAATLEALEQGLDVYGCEDGYQWLAQGDTKHMRPLTRDDVSRIHFQGGSILFTSRYNPTKDTKELNQVVRALRRKGVKYLVSIGGDDTAFTATEIARTSKGRILVVHVPKTIDNDLDLPGGMPTFGYQTARELGAELVRNLMTDCRTTRRWYFVEAMGRKAGHLALGIGKSSGATLTLIGEKFGGHVEIRELLDTLECGVLKRAAQGRPYGVVVLAEGIGEMIDGKELKKLGIPDLPLDEHGHVRLAELDLAKLLKRLVQERFAKRCDKVTIQDVKIGYEVRCAPPIAFDREYARDLGYGAVRYLLSDPPPGFDKSRGAMVCLDGGRIVPKSFDEMRDPNTGKTRVRLVDVNTESYAVAEEYMLWLKPQDFDDRELVRAMAKLAKMKVTDFRRRYGYLVGR